MTIEPIEIARGKLSSCVAENNDTSDKESEACNYRSVVTNDRMNNQLSFDPMESSVTKRRLSRQPCGSSPGSSEDDGGYTTKVGTTQDNGCDIRKELLAQEGKLFAELPDPNEDKVSPDEFLNKLVYATCGFELEPKKAKTLENFFVKVTDEQVAAYTITVVSACRSNDLDALKKLHSEDGQMMNCFNRFGESLLTMACRRGFEDIVDYLLHLPDVDVRISDDSGRTVLHDACWNPSPQLKICKWIMARDPALFFIADNRGCTPFEYARPEHWGVWRQFLLDNKESLRSLTQEDVKTKLSKALQ